MKYIFLLLCLIVVAITTIAQSKDSHLPPLRTTDNAPKTQKIKPTIPTRTGGQAQQTRTASNALPKKPGASGGSGAVTNNSRITPAAAKTMTNNTMGTTNNTNKAPAQLPSMESAGATKQLQTQQQAPVNTLQTPNGSTQTPVASPQIHP